MIGYLARRALGALFVIAGVLTLSFVIARVVPGDAAVAYAGPRASAEQLRAVRAEFGLDLPPLQQFFQYLGGILQGNWGTALHTKQPVLSDLLRVSPPTLVLVVASLLFAVVVGVGLGVLTASRSGRFVDALGRIVAVFSVSMPIFWLAILTQLLFFTLLRWLPVAGQYDSLLDVTNPLYSVIGVPVVDSLLTGNWPVFLSALQHMVLPMLAIGAYPMGAIAMATRASLLENLGEDHIRMVRALGFSERSVLWRFAMRPSVNPVISLLALLFAFSLTNSFIVESIFNWPGLGSYAIAAISALDIPAILGVTLLIAIVYVVLNFIVDLTQSLVDPRIRA